MGEGKVAVPEGAVMEVAVPEVLILGASTRAAAFSAIRSGTKAVCADLFADEDLRAVAEVLRVDDYPNGLAEVARRRRGTPWIYTGALENFPDLVAEISKDCPLLGNPAEVIRQVRDPQVLIRTLRLSEVRYPEVRSHLTPPVPDGRWMIKPRCSAGGLGVEVWNEATARARIPGPDDLFQRRIEGRVYGATYLAGLDRTLLLGVCEQLDERKSARPGPFVYNGSIGPMRLSSGVTSCIERCGERLATLFGLRGLFGCDYIVDEEQVWLIEVNPRYTASVEILEYAHKFPVFSWHNTVCRQFFAVADKSPVGHSSIFREIARRIGESRVRKPSRIVGKRIVYAERDLVMSGRLPQAFVHAHTVADALIPEYADVPAQNMRIPAGFPICSVLGVGVDRSTCLDLLDVREARVVEASRDA